MKLGLLLCALSSAVLGAAQAAAATASFDFVGLGTLGGSFSSGLAINDAGQVVGYSYGPGNGYAHAFRWFGGTMEDLGTRVAAIATPLASTVPARSQAMPTGRATAT